MNKKGILLLFLTLAVAIIAAGAVSAVNSSENGAVKTIDNFNSNPPPNSAADPIINGTVVDEKNQRVNGATITVYTLDDTEVSSTTTGPDGYYTTNFISSESNFKVKASYNGYLSPIQNITVVLNPEDSLYYGTADFQLGMIYVDGTNGSTTYDGSSPTPQGGTVGPKSTIQDGVDMAKDGWIVQILDGTYLENVMIDHPVKVIPYHGKDVKVHAADTGQPVFTINTNGSGSTIQGLTIQGATNSKGIYLVSSNSNTISGNTINQNDSGIHLIDSSNNQITYNQITYNYNGICFDYSITNTITGNNISNNDNYGIRLYASPNNTLTCNTIQDNVYNFSVEAWNVDHYIQNIYDPITHSENPETWNYINGNPIYYLTNQNNIILNGIRVGYIGLIKCNNITIENIHITHSGQGIVLADTTNSHIQNNIFNNNEYGIQLSSSSDNQITYNNQITDCTRAINLDYSSNNLISGNIINHNGSYWSSASGIVTLTNYSSNNQILNNYITDNTQGLQIRDNSQNNLIKGNQITQIQDYGIILHNVTLNEITENYLYNNSRGIMLENSSNNTISHNGITNSYSESDEWWGNYGVGCFTLLNSPENTISYNTLLNNKYSFAVLGTNTSDFIERIDTTNTINDKPIYYYINNPENTEINGTDTLNYPNGIGYLGLINCSEITISNIIISNNGQGLLLAGSSEIIIQNCNLSENINGINIYNSYSQIKGNNINDNHSNGIYIKNSDAIIQFNRIVNNPYGLDLIDDGSIDATLNWWGTNENPSDIINNESSESLTYDPWLILTLTVDPDQLSTGETSTITLDLNHDSNNDPVSGGNVPDGIAVTFNSGLKGTVDYNNQKLSDGKAGVIFTAGSSSGTGIITATVDGMTVSKDVTIEGTTAPPVHDITSGHDFTTIQEAINDASTLNGDIIEIDNGIYIENVIINKQLTLRPSNDASVTVQAFNPGYDVFLINADGSGSTIQGLIITGSTNNTGISLENTTHCTVSGNTISYNDRGIWLLSSPGNTLSGNIIIANTWNLYVTGFSDSEYVETIDTSNTINGKPVYYIVGNTTGLVIDGNNALYSSGIGFLGLVSCSNVTVQNINISNESGMLLAYTTGSTIKDSVFTSNRDGISLEHSNGNTISGNIMTNNEIGICLWDSGSSELPNTISGNYITSNTNGICLESHINTIYNTIIENNITLNGYGIVLDDLTNNTINFNRIVNNSNYAIYVYNSSSNDNATLNWWGTNDDTKTEILTMIYNGSNINYNPWLILTISADPTMIVPYTGVSNITAHLTHDSTYDPLNPSASEHDPASGHVPDGIPVDFLYDPASMGTITNTSVNTSNGKASIIFNAGSSTSPPSATITAKFDEIPVSVNVTIESTDTTPPTATANPPGKIFNGTLIVHLNATDDIDPAPDIYYTTDGTDPTVSSILYDDLTAIEIINTTELRFAALDAAGNWSQSYTEIYTIDEGTPQVAITDPTEGAYVNGTVNITATASDDTSITRIKFNSSSGLNYVDNDGTDGWSCDWDTTGLNGTYTITATAYDTVGNSADYTINVIIETFDPTAVDDDSTTPEDTPININILQNDTDPDGGLISVEGLTNGQYGTTTLNADGTITYTPNLNYNGEDQFTYTLNGGSTATVNIIITPVNDEPILNPIGNQSVNENTNLNFNTTGSDIDGDSLTYTTTGLPSGATFVNGVFNWTPNYTQSGKYHVTFTVSDGTLTANETITITVNNVNRAPILKSIGNRNIPVNNNLSIILNASDSDGDALNYSATGLPNGSSLIGNTFTWKPTSKSTNTITFRVSDGNLTDYETIKITVDTVPVFDSISNKIVNEGFNLLFTVKAIDKDNDALSYSATGLPIGANINPKTGTFTWIPTYNQAGVYTVTFKVSDGVFTTSKTIKITVKDTPIYNNSLKILNSGSGKIYVIYHIKITEKNGKVTNKTINGYINPGATLNCSIGSYPSKTRINMVQYIYNKSSIRMNISVDNYIYIKGNVYFHQKIRKRNIVAGSYVKI